MKLDLGLNNVIEVDWSNSKDNWSQEFDQLKRSFSWTGRSVHQCSRPHAVSQLSPTEEL